MPNPLYDLRSKIRSTPTDEPPAKASALPQAMVEDEKIRFLLSNPHLIASYGQDAATRFVDTLRDAQLDPVVRRERVLAQRVTLNQLVTDLDVIITRTTNNGETALASDATFMRENLSSLLAMSETLADVEVVSNLTESLGGVVDVVLDSRRLVVDVFDGDHAVYDSLGDLDEAASRHVVLVEHDSVRERNTRVLGYVLAPVLTSLILSLYLLGATDTLLAAGILGCLVVASLYAAFAVHVARPHEVISRTKFTLFVTKATPFTMSRVRSLLGFGRDNTNRTATNVVENEAPRRWFLEAGPIFEAISTESLETYVAPGKRTKRDVVTKEHLAIDKLAHDFEQALAHTDAYVQGKREEAEKARLTTLKKIEEDKRLADLTAKKNAVLDGFLRATRLVEDTPVDDTPVDDTPETPTSTKDD